MNQTIIECTIRFTDTEFLHLLLNGKSSVFPLETDKYYLCRWSRPDHDDWETIAYLWLE